MTQFIDKQSSLSELVWGGPQLWGGSQWWSGGQTNPMVDLSALNVTTIADFRAISSTNLTDFTDNEGIVVITTGNPIGLLLVLTYT